MTIRTSLTILTFLFISSSVWTQELSSFSNLLEAINKEDESEKNALVESFLKKAGQTPIIEGHKAIFLAKGNVTEKPYLLADFNGFLHRRYVKDPSIGAMKAIEGTSWFYLEKELEPNAIINYQIRLGERTSTDPLNPETRTGFGNLYSVLKMPAYQASYEILWDASLPTGQLIKDSIYSKALGHFRTIHIYLPPGYKQSKEKYSSVYFHDGSFFIREGLVPRILDNLIGQKKITPVVAAFDDPVQRGKEYRGDENYKRYLKEELIPFVNRTYRAKNDKRQRAVIGFSRAGQSSLYVTHNLDLFAKCGAFSPAIHPTSISDFTTKLAGLGFQPEHLFMTGSTYDFLWYPDAVALREHFQKSGIKFQYVEIPEGHNIPAWRTLLDDMLIAFFAK